MKSILNKRSKELNLASVKAYRDRNPDQVRSSQRKYYQTRKLYDNLLKCITLTPAGIKIDYDLAENYCLEIPQNVEDLLQKMIDYRRLIWPWPDIYRTLHMDKLPPSFQNGLDRLLDGYLITTGSEQISLIIKQARQNHETI